MKRTYQKPEIKEVKLKTEESLLTACRGTQMFGPEGNDCISPCSGEQCREMYG